MKKFFTTIVFALFCASAAAQTIGGVTATGVSMIPDGEGLLLKMTVTVAPNSVTSLQSMSVIPVLSDGAGSSVRFPHILINGKNRSKIYERQLKFGHADLVANPPWRVINLDRRNRGGTIEYLARLDGAGRLAGGALSLVFELGSPAGVRQTYAIPVTGPAPSTPSAPYVAQAAPPTVSTVTQSAPVPAPVPATPPTVSTVTQTAPPVTTTVEQAVQPQPQQPINRRQARRQRRSAAEQPQVVIQAPPVIAPPVIAPVPVIVETQPQPAQTQPQPASVVVQTQTQPQPQPATTQTQPRPEVAVQPVVTAPEPRPAVVAPEPQPVATRPESRPVVVQPEPKPETRPTSSRTVGAVSGTANLDFETASSVLLPGLGRNSHELAAVDEKIRSISADGPVRVVGLTVTGYSSPDGRYGTNAFIALDRASALADYMQRQLRISEDIVDIAGEGENWNDFRRIIYDGDMPERDEILRVIDSQNAPDAKESILRRMQGGAVWHTLEDRLFPALRKVDYTIEYEIIE